MSFVGYKITKNILYNLWLYRKIAFRWLHQTPNRYIGQCLCYVWYLRLHDSLNVNHLTNLPYASFFVYISFLTCEFCYANESLGQASPFLLHAHHVSLP